MTKKETKANKTILPPNYKPSENEPYMNELQLEYFRQKLLNWKDEMLTESGETINHLKEENWNEADLNEKAVIEAEVTTELRTRNRYKKLISKIDESLEMVEDGSYGYCVETGEEIGIKRLEARPVAHLCIEAQQRHERHEKTHIDKDSILLEEQYEEE